MTSEAQHGTELVHVVALLAAGVIAVPIFKRLGDCQSPVSIKIVNLPQPM